MPAPGYKGVNLPQVMIDAIDDLGPRWGYPSRDDFAQEACREKILRLREVEAALSRAPPRLEPAGPGAKRPEK